MMEQCNPWMDDSIEEADKQLTPEDYQRMRTMQSGDSVSDYKGFPEIQKYMIAEEKAAIRRAQTEAIFSRGDPLRVGPYLEQ